MKKRYKIIVPTLLTFQFGFAQEDSLSFKVSSNYLDGKSYWTKTKTIVNPNSPIDVYFFKEHFGKFYGLPKTLIKNNLKSKEITEWAYEKTSANIIKNSSESYKYDSEGKLIEYKFITCAICSSFSYGYRLIYDSNNRIIEQQKFSLRKIESEKYSSYDSHHEFDKLKSWIVLTYDADGTLIKYEECKNNGIQELIELVD